MRAFFFPHQREFRGKHGDAPGRVPFDIVGELVDETRTRRGAAIICADGYALNQCASNQDPCVFSRPIGPIHSFCRLDHARGKDHFVLELSGQQKDFLSDVVAPGDLIFYGKSSPPAKGAVTRIWVDAVIVVKRRVRWTTSTKNSPKCNSRSISCNERKFQFRSAQTFAESLTGIADSDAYRFNLRDAEADGAHCCTANHDPHIIEGTFDPTASALARRTTSFVPLANRDGDEWWPAFVQRDDVSPDTWASFVTLFDRLRRNPRSGFICELDVALAEGLWDAIVRVSGRGQGMARTVAVPPLIPTESVTRWSPPAQAFVRP